MPFKGGFSIHTLIQTVSASPAKKFLRLLAFPGNQHSLGYTLDKLGINENIWVRDGAKARLPRI